MIGSLGDNILESKIWETDLYIGKYRYKSISRTD